MRYPAVIDQVGEVGFVAFAVQRADGDEQGVRGGPCGHGQGRIGRTRAAAAGEGDHDLAIQRQAQRSACRDFIVAMFAAGTQAAAVEGLRAGPVGVVRLFQALVEGREHAGTGIVGGQVAGIAAIAVHADLDRRYAGDACEQGQFGRYVDHEQPGIAVVQMVENTAHGLAHRGQAQRYAVHDRRRGLVVEFGRGNGRADHVRQGDDFDIALEAVEQGRVSRENADRLRGRQLTHDRHRALGMSAALVMNEKTDRFGHGRTHRSPTSPGRGTIAS